MNILFGCFLLFFIIYSSTDSLARFSDDNDGKGVVLIAATATRRATSEWKMVGGRDVMIFPYRSRWKIMAVV